MEHKFHLVAIIVVAILPALSLQINLVLRLQHYFTNFTPVFRLAQPFAELLELQSISSHHNNVLLCAIFGGQSCRKEFFEIKSDDTRDVHRIV